MDTGADERGGIVAVGAALIKEFSSFELLIVWALISSIPIPRRSAVVQNHSASEADSTRCERSMSKLEEIVDTFEFLEGWDARYQYLIELGERLPAMQATLKTEENWVKPCMSTVYVAAQQVPEQPHLIRFVGDCDSAIIKGVLALLIDLFSYRTYEEIHAMDVDGLFKRLQLAEHLSPNRHVGIYAIVDKLRERSAEAAAPAN